MIILVNDVVYTDSYEDPNEQFPLISVNDEKIEIRKWGWWRRDFRKILDDRNAQLVKSIETKRGG